MKKNRIILLTFLLSLNYIFSQSSSGIATYKVTPISLVKNGSSYFQELQSRKERTAEFIEYKLKFSNNKSVFYLGDILKDEAKTRTVKLFDVGYIFNIQGRKLIQKKQYGSNFIIKSNLSNVKWVFSKETKFIGKYRCYKATTIKKIVNPVRVFHRNITAWYCPEIPVSSGPMGYGNLPGLILELRIDKKGIYTMRDITFSTKSITIEEPKKGMLVTEKEFDKIGLEMYQKRQNGM